MPSDHSLHRYIFAVADQIYCCWEHNLPDRNEQFLRSFDSEYFNYVAHRHMDQLESEDKQRAAVALRAAYYHGLETLFSLLGAMAQAPDAVPAWIPKCSTGELRRIVNALQLGRPILTQTGRQSLTLRELAGITHEYCWPDDNPTGITGERYGRLWERFADDFVDEKHVAEYNNIKHGLRVAAGGSTLRIGRQEGYCVPAPEANMQTIGTSSFGSRCYLPEPLGVSHHFRIRRNVLNWRAEAMVQRLQLIAWSINNVVGALRCLGGSPPGSVQFHRPEDPDAFDAAWRWGVGVDSWNLDIEIAPADIDPVSRDELLRELEARGAEGVE